MALDRDPTAIAAGLASQAYDTRLTLVEARFGTLDAVVETLALPPLDGVVLDIGVSSMQFDEAERGFSFRFDGPLDMRMSREGRSAADIVNGTAEEDLADILYRYGEERASRRIARAIALRPQDPNPSPRPGLWRAMIAPHHAGQAGRHSSSDPLLPGLLRIAVNDELGELHDALEAAERRLATGGYARRGDVSFARRPDRQAVLPKAGPGAPMPGRAHFARRDQPALPRPSS